MTPDEKYMNDSPYRAVVDLLEMFVLKYHFTPSEVREMAVLACTRAEMRRPVVVRCDTDSPECTPPILFAQKVYGRTPEVYPMPGDR